MAGRRRERAAPPSSGYQEWAAFLERWAEGGPVDSSALGPLAEESFAGDTWGRLAHRFTTALQRRLDLWGAAHGRATGAARDEFEYGRALQQSRTGLRAIRALATDERLPTELRTRLTGLVDGAVRSMQEQLEKQVERMRGGGDADRRAEARRRTLRENPLTAVIGDTAVERAASATPLGTPTTAGPTSPPAPPAAADPFDPPRRRIARP